jgi:hypothetical protein
VVLDLLLLFLGLPLCPHVYIPLTLTTPELSSACLLPVQEFYHPALANLCYMDLYLELCLLLDLKPFPPVLHCTARYPRPQHVKLLLIPQVRCHDSDDAGLNQYSAGPHGRGQSSNFSLTSCIVVKPLPLLLLKR